MQSCAHREAEGIDLPAGALLFCSVLAALADQPAGSQRSRTALLHAA